MPLKYQHHGAGGVAQWWSICWYVQGLGLIPSKHSHTHLYISLSAYHHNHHGASALQNSLAFPQKVKYSYDLIILHLDMYQDK